MKLIKKLSRLHHAPDKILRSACDNRALMQLQPFLSGIYFPLTPNTLNPHTTLHVINEIDINKRKSIVEFGSGFSTLAIAGFLKKYDIKATFLSIEQNESWANYIQKKLTAMHCTDKIHLIKAPLAPSKYKWQDAQDWYNTEIIQENLPATVDLLLVDGPGADTQKSIRYPAFPFLEERMEDSFSVFLDDTRRPAEKKIIEEWAKQSHSEVESFPVYGVIYKGIHFSSNPLTH